MCHNKSEIMANTFLKEHAENISTSQRNNKHEQEQGVCDKHRVCFHSTNINLGVMDQCLL
jgi:hypothetical protein